MTSGIEWAIPLAAIGNPTGDIAVCAFMGGGLRPPLGNQVLGPLPPGTCALGNPAAVSFGAIPGPQFFTVINGATPTLPLNWGRVQMLYR